jgi:hypothetical protein
MLSSLRKWILRPLMSPLLGTNATLGNFRFSEPVMRTKRTSLIPWRSVAFYEYVPSTKTQNEENRAVMGRELLWAVCAF